MDDNRNITTDSEKNEHTRSIPRQERPAAASQGTSPDGTRQIPIQGNGRTSSDVSERTREIPLHEKDRAASDVSGKTREIPLQRRTGTSGTSGSADRVTNTSAGAGQPAVKNRTAADSSGRSAASGSGQAHGTNGRTGTPISGTSLPDSRAADVSERSAPAEFSKTKEVRSASVTIPKDDSDSAQPKIPGVSADHAATPSQKIGKRKKKNAAKDAADDEKKSTRESGGGTIISIVKAVVYIVSVLVISITASVFIILVGNDVYAFVKADTPVEVTIPEGADVEDIATLLANNGIINYPGIFKFYASYKNDDGIFLAGTYQVSPSMDYDDLLYAFKEHEVEGTSMITIPEGYTTDEIIDLFVESGIGTKEGYIDVINNYAFDYWFVQELDATDWKSTGRYYRLDGYLFPDTYEFYNKSSEKTVIGKLLARFNVIYGDKYREAAEALNMTTDQIVTIASMIEKEAVDASEYHRVSSVFHNRLRSEYYPKLESDATILYAIHHDTGERPNMTTFADLEYDSPYNTYLYDGLPPGPIANPSASSITAALTPEETNFYYFIYYNAYTHFASTLDEHLANVAERDRMREEANQQQ